MPKRTSKLALKFIIGFIILGILICAASSSIGYYHFQNTVKKQYNDTAYDVAQQAVTYLDMEDVAYYLDLIKRSIAGENVEQEFEAVHNSAEYQQVQDLFKDLRISMGANDVFLAYPDMELMNSFDGTLEGWEPVYYIYDSYNIPEYSYQLGQTSPFNPDFIQEINNIFSTGLPSDSHFISKSAYGYNTSAVLPVTVGDEIITLIVEIPMLTIQSVLVQYLIYAVAVTIAVIIIVISLYMVYLLRRVIRPINSIAQEAGNFVQNGVSESTSLATIKTGDEIENLSQSILKMQSDINDYIQNLTQITAERERIGAELDVAKNIQSSMLPCIFPAFPNHPEFDVFATMEPAKEVGGDFYDFFLCDESHLVMVIADVSGKGVPAALFMMISKTLLKSAAQTGLSPKQILEKVNNQLCENNDAEMFVTVWLGILDLNTGKLTCANAGHEYPAIYRKDQGFELYHDRHGFVLAGMENVRYREYELQIDPGDIIYVYTDGVAEATDIHNELYGTDRMMEALNRCPDKNPSAIAAYVRSDVDCFVGEAEQFDDITMLCVKYIGQEGGEHQEGNTEE